MKCRKECRICIMLNNFTTKKNNKPRIHCEIFLSDISLNSIWCTFHYIQLDLMKFIQNKQKRKPNYYKKKWIQECINLGYIFSEKTTRQINEMNISACGLYSGEFNNIFAELVVNDEGISSILKNQYYFLSRKLCLKKCILNLQLLKLYFLLIFADVIDDKRINSAWN